MNNEKRFLLSMILLILYNFNFLLNFLIVGIIIFLFWEFSIEDDLILYIAFIPWERVIFLPKLGSVFRIFQIIILFKIFYLVCFKNLKIKFKVYQLVIILGCLFYSILEVVLYKQFIGITLVLNLIILSFFNIIKNDNFIEKIYNNYVLSVIIAIFYGLIHLKFIKSWVSNLGYIYRFSGVYEPNYMAFYINLAIIIVITFGYKNNKKKKIYCLFLLYLGLALTCSMSGILINLGIMFIYIIFKYRHCNIKRFIVMTSKILIVSVILVTSIANIELLKPIKIRIVNTIENVLQGNINEATSDRSDVVEKYFLIFEQETIEEKMFGNANFSSYNYAKKNDISNIVHYSHNTYIDILFTFGLITGIILLLSIFIKMICNWIKNKNITMLLIRICVLTSIFGVSAFTSRVFYFWFFI